MSLGTAIKVLLIPKIILPSALVSMGIILFPTAAEAQPGGGFNFRSVETCVIQAPVVFRGAITKVSDSVIHTNNQFSREDVFTNKPVEHYDIHNYTVTLRVDEVLKGTMSRQPLEFTINGVGKSRGLEKWAEERASLLWFVNDSEKSIAADLWAGVNYIFLGPRLPGRTDDLDFKRLERVYGVDMTLLTKPRDILARARTSAKKRLEAARFHNIYLPELSSSDHFFVNSYLTVPVEPSLEKTAKRLIAAPDDFISTKDKSAQAPQWRCDLRAEGVNALQYFKSAKNIKLLKSLLDSADFWAIEDWSPEYRAMNMTCKTYSVRKKAYEVLHGWGVDVPKPATEETIPANERYP